MGADIKHHEQVTEPLPPETTTPMPAQLHWAYDKLLGWPGNPNKVPPGDLSVRTATVKP